MLNQKSKEGMVMETQGERIKSIRLELRLSQDKFGEGLGITKQYVSSIENGIALLSNEKLTSLLLNYNVNINYILTGKGEVFLGSDKKEEDTLENKIQEVALKMKENGLL